MSAVPVVDPPSTISAEHGSEHEASGSSVAGATTVDKAKPSSKKLRADKRKAKKKAYAKARRLAEFVEKGGDPADFETPKTTQTTQTPETSQTSETTGKKRRRRTRSIEDREKRAKRSYEHRIAGALLQLHGLKKESTRLPPGAKREEAEGDLTGGASRHGPLQAPDVRGGDRLPPGAIRDEEEGDLVGGASQLEPLQAPGVRGGDASASAAMAGLSTYQSSDESGDDHPTDIESSAGDADGLA